MSEWIDACLRGQADLEVEEWRFLAYVEDDL
jgi:hypothetical protein